MVAQQPYAVFCANQIDHLMMLLFLETPHHCLEFQVERCHLAIVPAAAQHAFAAVPEPGCVGELMLQAIVREPGVV